MRLATGMMITRVAPHVSSASHSLCVRCSSRAMPLPAHASSSSPALCDPVSEVLRCRSSAAATPRRWWRLPARSVSPLGAWALALIPESGARRGDNHRAQCPPGAFGAPRLRRRVPLAEGGFGCRALQGGGPSEAKEGICAELQREDGLAAIAIPTRRVCLEVKPFPNVHARPQYLAVGVYVLGRERPCPGPLCSVQTRDSATWLINSTRSIKLRCHSLCCAWRLDWTRRPRQRHM